MTTRRRPLARAVAAVACILVVTATGCERRASADTPPSGAWARQSLATDGALPIAEQLRRFQAGLEPPVGFSDGAPSRDSLVRAFVAGVGAADTAALARLAMTRAEFAYLYYPDNPQSRPPYELDPALMWMQVSAGSARGLGRLMTDFGGLPLRAVGYRCAAPVEQYHAVTVQRGCVVLRLASPRDTVEESLFGGIVEHAGRFKFMGYAGRR